VVKARLRRLACPVHGVRVEGVDFARPSSRFTRDFEQLVAWPAVKMVQDALWRLVDIDWDSVGRICDRVVAKRAPGDRRCHAQVTDRKGPASISCDTTTMEEGRMTDVLIRDVPEDVVSAIEAKAKRLGLSRTEYLRRQMVRVASTSDEPVTVESLRQFAQTFADLADPEVMRGAWE
jgi:hypothetical protein